MLYGMIDIVHYLHRDKGPQIFSCVILFGTGRDLSLYLPYILCAKHLHIFGSKSFIDRMDHFLCYAPVYYQGFSSVADTESLGFRIIYNIHSEQSWTEYLNQDDPAIKETLRLFKAGEAFPQKPVVVEAGKKVAHA